MNWYLKVVKDNYANFDGRARRKEYWMFTLINSLILFGLIAISVAISVTSDALGFLSLYFIYILAMIIPSLAVSVRRLHDIGKSGWYYLVAFIPFIGTFWLLFLLITEGEKGSNAYGPDPKNITAEEIDQIGQIQVD
ncbi:DUF805 domain-containing protein [Aestuariibaculum lutulentum]|uniref:DUF805 domain-containing protein n=1 Tax=Aestuariibaculum lutulentum TaxID=2920935 RepID=A0ABS9REP0_9FLAO|nr:DUF805 domain-containing protein [Aestuariibaculum lutulentum]MCH4551409.1 DUF805 domain-containing protein [Aestuariibaculum lutulentum]